MKTVVIILGIILVVMIVAFFAMSPKETSLLENPSETSAILSSQQT